MPLKYRSCTLLFGLALFLLNHKTTSSEPLKYGTRLHLQNESSKASNSSECINCNRTSTNILQRRTMPQTFKSNFRKDPIANLKESKTANQNFHFTVKPLLKKQQTPQPFFSKFPNENTNGGATFFFTQVEPHRFEYRAMFQHSNEAFQPFVHNFEPFTANFPPLPKFPEFPKIPEVFHNKDHFSNFPDFPFPNLPPTIKRIWQPQIDLQFQKPELPESFEDPLEKNFNLIFGQEPQYPKIFRFNEERINIEEFDKQKKLRHFRLTESGENELEEPENVKRDHLLILHGGIFTVQEPPLFNKHIKRVRKRNGYRRQT